MRTNIIKYVVAIACSATVMSCDDFLTENPENAIYADQVYESIESAVAGYNGVYSDFSSFTKNMILLTLPNSIYGVSGYDHTKSLGTNNLAMANLACFIHDSSNTYIDWFFSNIYDVVDSANHFIYNMDAAGFEGEQADQMVGEVKFLRGYAYFCAVRLFGGVPLVTTPTFTADDVNQPRAKVEDMFDQIIEDLNDAFEMMPKRGEQSLGYPTNYAAKALLAQVYAQMATSDYLFYNATNPYNDTDRAGFWQKCYDAAREVYDDGGYELVDDYKSLWKCHEPVGEDWENSKESIFETNYNLAANNCGWAYYTMPNLSSLYTPNATTGTLGIRPSQVIYQKHLNRYSTFDTTEGGVLESDPRIAATYIVDSYEMIKDSSTTTISLYPSTSAQLGTQAGIYPQLIKYCDDEYQSYSACGTNWIHIRYAEILLLLAEAAHEVGKDDDEKYGYVDKVLTRARGTGTHPANWARTLSDDDFIDAVFDERLYELPMEQSQWFDVRRRGTERFLETAEKYNNMILESSPWNNLGTGGCYISNYTYTGSVTTIDVRMFIPETNTQKYMLLPLPADEIQYNTSISLEDQNHGYQY